MLDNLQILHSTVCSDLAGAMFFAGIIVLLIYLAISSACSHRKLVRLIVSAVIIAATLVCTFDYRIIPRYTRYHVVLTDDMPMESLYVNFKNFVVSEGIMKFESRTRVY